MKPGTVRLSVVLSALVLGGALLPFMLDAWLEEHERAVADQAAAVLESMRAELTAPAREAEWFSAALAKQWSCERADGQVTAYTCTHPLAETFIMAPAFHEGRMIAMLVQLPGPGAGSRPVAFAHLARFAASMDPAFSGLVLAEPEEVRRTERFRHGRLALFTDRDGASLSMGFSEPVVPGP